MYLCMWCECRCINIFACVCVFMWVCMKHMSMWRCQVDARTNPCLLNYAVPTPNFQESKIFNPR